MLRSFLLVGLGGCIGSMLRYGVSLLAERYISHAFAFGTFAVNIIGCFLIGLLFGYAQRMDMMTANMWLILGTGFCGGFTTFSTFALESNAMVNSGHNMMMLLYTGLSLVVGLLLCRAGMLLAA